MDVNREVARGSLSTFNSYLIRVESWEKDKKSPNQDKLSFYSLALDEIASAYRYFYRISDINIELIFSHLCPSIKKLNFSSSLNEKENIFLDHKNDILHAVSELRKDIEKV